MTFKFRGAEIRSVSEKKPDALDELMSALAEMEDAEEWKFAELPVRRIIRQSPNAVLLDFEPHAFQAPRSATAPTELWFPLSMMRHYESGIYFHKLIAKEKGLTA